MFSCREAARLMSDGLERKLSFLERVSMRAHMAICSTCRVYKRQIEWLDRILTEKFSEGTQVAKEGTEPILAMSAEKKESMKKAIREAG